MTAVTASAPGKLFLAGEYVVLRGAPAVVAAIDRRVSLRFEPGGAALEIESLVEGRTSTVTDMAAARDQRIYGSLVATVSIKSDGSLERVDINRSSGNRILDAAALRIVNLAAPYAPFPADIAKDTDVISITRTCCPAVRSRP